MTTTILVISGEIASGKTTLATACDANLPGTIQIKTRDEIGGTTRAEKQARGDKLDQETNYAWAAQLLLPLIANGHRYVIVDAVRRKEQVSCIRDLCTPRAQVLHVHLEANGVNLRNRFAERGDQLTITYEEMKSQATEAQVTSLREVADLTVDTSQCHLEEVLLRTLALLGTAPATRVSNR